MKAVGAEALELPAVFTIDFARLLSARLEAATRNGTPTSQVLTADTASQLFDRATQLLRNLPTLVEVSRALPSPR